MWIGNPKKVKFGELVQGGGWYQKTIQIGVMKDRLVNVVRDRIGRENQMLAANLRKSFSTHVVERFGDFIREFHQLLVVGFI
jgi:hypothetical protein